LTVQDWTLVHFKNSAELALLSPKVGCAMDGDTRSAVLLWFLSFWRVRSSSSVLTPPNW